MRKQKVYRIIIEDESRLEDVAQVRMSGWKFYTGLAACIAGIFLVTGLIIMFTPLRTLLPGYLKEAQRDSTIENMMRLDSLQNAFEQNRNFLNNIITILDTEREPRDSADIEVNKNPLTVDSIIEASESEKKFVKMMETREKYNISILAPLAAEGLVFEPVSPGAVQTAASRKSTHARYVIPAGEDVAAVTDGTVVDIHYSQSAGGYVLVIQHPKGFMSRVSGVGTPLVSTGDRVESGRVVALASSPLSHGNRTVGFELWRNGDALEPGLFLMKDVPAANEK